MDSLSHVLVWSTSTAEPGEECEISRVELPRLQTSFELRGDSSPKLYSLDHDGLFISPDPDSVSSHTVGLPHAMVLENRAGTKHIMVPNYGIQRVEVKACPFTTEVVFDRSRNWSEEVKKRFYVFDVHLSNAFVITPSLASSFYLVVVKLFAREYCGAARLISTCATDMKFTQEERWIMGLVLGTEKDMHPDAHACRLRLSLVCKDSDEKIPWDVKENPGDKTLHEKDVEGYFQKYSHVSAACRLTMDEEYMLGIGAKRKQHLAALRKTEKGESQEIKYGGSAPTPCGGAPLELFQISPRMLPVTRNMYVKYTNRARQKELACLM
jgi:hypothetical protein